MKKGITIGIILITALCLSGCEPKFSEIGDESEGYEVFSDYDIRELEEQIPEYWSYYEESGREKERVLQEVALWDTEWITEGTYVAGRDIESGIYIAWQEDGDILVTKHGPDGKEETESYMGYFYNTVYYLYLEEGDSVTLPGGSKIAPAGDGSPSLNAKKDNIYYEGSYKVGEELPEGEYFVINLLMEGFLFGEYDYLAGPEPYRFLYMTIQDVKVLNVKNCILFPLEDKPAVYPIRYQGEGEGEGQHVYPNGMYEIGTDLPTGTYMIKNELFHPVRDLSFQGYHGNAASYYPSNVNWCGLTASRPDDWSKLGWGRIELDNQVNGWWRTIKVRSLTGDRWEYSYKRFWGLPTITFTEDDAGCRIAVKNCILIPQTQ